jgi:hypothetical protein
MERLSDWRKVQSMKVCRDLVVPRARNFDPLFFKIANSCRNHLAISGRLSHGLRQLQTTRTGSAAQPFFRAT